MTITQLIVCIAAGLGAGLGTGLAGLSAAAVVSPMLITFLHMPAYQAIGIALASDVLASGVSAWTYKKNKNIDIRHGLIGSGVYASHGYERSHVEGALATLKTLIGYVG